MKKTMILTMALGMVGFAATSFADVTPYPLQKNTGGSGITNSSHDLGTGGGYSTQGDAQGRICVFCHHPHHTIRASDGETAYSPLWNRTMPTSTFTAYSNGNMMGDASSPQHTMNGTVSVGAVSLLCMSCHDGVTALNAYSENTTTTGTYGTAGGTGSAGATSGTANYLNTNANLGTDLSNHHPIGMTWDYPTLDDEIAADTAEWKNADGSNLGFQIDDVLSGGKMECVTCHDVHNTKNETGAERFLWVSNNDSKFCLTCHLK